MNDPIEQAPDLKEIGKFFDQPLPEVRAPALAPKLKDTVDLMERILAAENRDMAGRMKQTVLNKVADVNDTERHEFLEDALCLAVVSVLSDGEVGRLRELIDQA